MRTGLMILIQPHTHIKHLSPKKHSTYYHSWIFLVCNNLIASINMVGKLKFYNNNNYTIMRTVDLQHHFINQGEIYTTLQWLEQL